MSCTSKVKAALSRVTMAADTITSASSVLLTFVSSADEAASAWLSSVESLASSDPSALLPALYVANDTLQKSARGGTAFLEAFSTRLAPAFRIAVWYHRDRGDKRAVEKVRNIAKILGDRCVYSKRFIAELLKEMDKRPEVKEVKEVKEDGFRAEEKSEVSLSLRIPDSSRKRKERPAPAPARSPEAASADDGGFDLFMPVAKGPGGRASPGLAGGGGAGQVAGRGGQGGGEGGGGAQGGGGGAGRVPGGVLLRGGGEEDGGARGGRTQRGEEEDFGG